MKDGDTKLNRYLRESMDPHQALKGQILLALTIKLPSLSVRNKVITTAWEPTFLLYKMISDLDFPTILCLVNNVKCRLLVIMLVYVVYGFLSGLHNR